MLNIIAIPVRRTLVSLGGLTLQHGDRDFYIKNDKVKDMHSFDGVLYVYIDYSTYDDYKIWQRT